jgi:hypothetical protein
VRPPFSSMICVIHRNARFNWIQLITVDSTNHRGICPCVTFGYLPLRNVFTANIHPTLIPHLVLNACNASWTVSCVIS